MSQQIASVTEIIKYVEKLLLFACLVFSRTLCQTVYKFQASSFDELSFFPRAGLLCLVKYDEGRFSSSVFTSWGKPQDTGFCVCRDGGRSGLNGLPSKTAQKWVLHEKRLRIF